MRKSILRLITVCATVALLCGAMLCFSLTSAEAANLIVNGDFSNGLTGWTVSKMDGATVTNGQLVINQPEIDNGTVSASFTGAIKASTEYTIRYDATNVQNLEVKVHYTQGFGGNDGGMLTIPANQNFTFSTSESLQDGDFSVEIGGARYTDVTGTLDNFILVEGSSISGDVTTPSSSESSATESSATEPSETEPSETQPSQQGGSTELTDNWEALDPAQAAAVSFSNGTLSINAGLVEGDVKAGQTVSLAAGTYTLTADKTGDLSFSAKWEGNEVGETEGKLTFTLPAATNVQIVAFQYRGTSGTASNIVLSGGGSQPTTPSASSSETTPSGSETQPTSAPTSGNLIVNGSFNSGISGWTLTNIDENSAKVQDGALVVNQANGWHVDIRPTISGTIKANTQYTLKYEASNVNNLQVTVHLAPGFGGGASIQAAPGETTFTTAADLTANDFYVTIEIIADGDVSGTFDNFVLVEGTNTDVTDPSVDPSQSGTQPSTNPSQNPGQVGKVVVWSGTIGRDFTTKVNGLVIINEDALTQALRNDLAANGAPIKYEVEANATYTSGPSGYVSWGFYQENGGGLEIWADRGSSLTSAVISDANVAKMDATASLCFWSEGGNDVANVQSLTLYAYREGGTTNPSSSETTPSGSETNPSSSETTPSGSESDPSGSETDPSTSETTPSQPTDGKVLVWTGNLGADFVTADIGIEGMGVAPIQNQEMMTAVMGELLQNGIPEKIEIKSQLGYLGGPSGFAAIGLYSNGQVIWPDNNDPSDAIFSNLSGLGTDTALVVFSYGAGDTLHIDGMEIYAYRAQPSQSETEPTGISTPGDANGDGALNMKDVLVLRKFLADLPVEMDEAAADVNGDGAINMKDVLQMRKIIANS